jgi:hypothetical protein
VPAWPDGVALRPFVREADARAVHRLVQDAFADIGNQPARSFEFWERTSLERAGMRVEHRFDFWVKRLG